WTEARRLRVGHAAPVDTVARRADSAARTNGGGTAGADTEGVRDDDDSLESESADHAGPRASRHRGLQSNHPQPLALLAAPIQSSDGRYAVHVSGASWHGHLRRVQQTLREPPRHAGLRHAD